MRNEKVYEWLSRKGFADRVIDHTDTIDTVEHAAKQLGCSEAEIAKTLSFLVEGKPVIVVMAGDGRVNCSKFKAQFHTKPSMIPRDRVEELTGFLPGGVCPFAVPDDIPVWLDEIEGFYQDLFMINIFNGRGTIDSEKLGSRPAVFCQEYLSGIPAGMYSLSDSSDTGINYLIFRDDGRTGTMLINKYNSNLRAEGNIPFTYTIGENGRIAISYNDITLNGNVMRNMDNDGIYILIPETEEYWSIELYLNLITDDQDKISKLRSFDEMRQLATAYISAVLCADCTPDKSQAALFSYHLGSVGNDCFIDIDPFTLDVTDDEGNQGNLLNPPKMPENAAYTMDELRDSAVAALKERTGIQAEYAKGVLRNDGSVLIVLRDFSGVCLDYYIADPVTGNVTPKQHKRGDANCDGNVDVADAVLLSRMLAEDAEAVLTDEGRDNADCDLDCRITFEDVTYILMKIAKKIRF